MYFAMKIKEDHSLMVLSMPSNLYKTYLREYFPKKPAHGSTFSTRPNVYGISANLTSYERLGNNITLSVFQNNVDNKKIWIQID